MRKLFIHTYLAKVSLEDADAAVHVWKGDVDELVETAGAGDGVIQDVGPVGSADDEHGLAGSDTVDLRQDLVDHAVRCLAAAAAAPTASLKVEGTEAHACTVPVQGDAFSGGGEHDARGTGIRKKEKNGSAPGHGPSLRLS